MSNSSASLDVNLAFKNPTPLAVPKIDYFGLYFGVEGTNIFFLNITNLSLVQGINSNWTAGVSINFLAPGLDLVSSQNAINAAQASYLATGDFNMSISGPVIMSKFDPMANITQNLRINMALSEILNLTANATSSVSSSVSSTFSQLFTASSLKKIVSNSVIAAAIQSDRITTNLSLVLPDIFPIPPTVSIPFGTTLSLAKGPQDILQLFLNGVDLARSNGSIRLNTSFAIIPENTNNAATALASVLNPVLSVNPNTSSVDVLGISFLKAPAVNPNGTQATPDTWNPFNWCKIVENIDVNIGIPAIDISSWLASAIKVVSNSTTSAIPFSVDNMLFQQLPDRPGFGINGHLNVQSSVGLPQINIGYLGGFASIGAVKMIYLEMPKGLRLFPKTNGTRINATAVLNTDPALAPQVQALSDGFLRSLTMPPYLGLSGLLFGVSPSSLIVTFSKVAVQLKFNVIKSALATTSLAPNTVQLSGLDFNMMTSQHAVLSVQANVKNPYNISIAVGKIDFQVLMDDRSILNISVPAMNSVLPITKIATSIDVQIAAAKDGLATKLGTFVRSITCNDSSSPILAGISNIRMTLPNSNSSSSTLNQLSSVKFVTTASFVNSFVNTPKTTDGFVTLSSAFKVSNPLTAANLNMSQLTFVVGSNATMNIGVQVSYKNPYPVSENVLYTSGRLNLNETPAIDFLISGLAIQQPVGQMGVSVSLSFRNNNTLPDIMNNLVNSFINGTLNTSVSISNVFFGTGPSDVNNLLVMSVFDVTSIVSKISASNAKTLARRAITTLSLSNNSIQASIDSFNFKVQPGAVLNTSVIGSMQSGFSSNVSLPFIQTKVNLNKISLANISISNTSLQGPQGKAPFGSSVNLALNDVDAIANTISSIVNQYNANSPLIGSLDINGLVLGVSPTDSINLFSKLQLSIPINKLIGGSLSAIDLSTIASQFDLQSVSLDTRPQRIVTAGATASFNNVANVSIQGLGYFSAIAGVDAVPLVHAVSEGISISAGQNKLSAGVNLLFPSSIDTQSKVKGFGNSISTLGLGNTNEKFTLSNLTIGYSSTNNIKMLSKAIFMIPSSKVLNTDNLNSAVSLAPSSGPLGIKAANVSFLPSSIIQSDISVAPNVSFDVSVSIPMIETVINIDELQLAAVSITGTSASGVSGNVTAGTSLQVNINDIDPVSTRISNIATSIGASGVSKSTIGINGFVFGVSESDYIDTFSQLSLSTLISSIDLNSTSLNVDVSPMLGDVSVSSVTLAANKGQAISAGGSVLFSSKSQLSLSGFGFFTTALGLDNTQVMSINIPSVSVARYSSGASASINLQFPSSNDIKNKLQSFGDSLTNNGIGNTPERILIAQPIFGYSRTDYIKLFSKTNLMIQTSKIINPTLVSNIVANAKSQQSVLSLSTANIDIRNTKSINAQLNGLVSTSFPITVNIPLVSGASYVNGASAFDLATTSVNVKTGKSNQLSVNSMIKVHDTDSLATNIGQLSAALAESADLPGTIGIGSFVIGNSATDFIDTFSQFTYMIPATYLDSVFGISKTVQSFSMSDTISSFTQTSNSTLSIQSVSLTAIPNQSLLAGANVQFSQSLGLTVTGLNLLSLDSGISGVHIASLNSNGITIAAPSYASNISATVYAPSSASSKQIISVLSSDFAANGFHETKHTFDLSNIVFGYDQSTAFQFLSNCALRIPLSAFVSNSTIELANSTASNSFNVIDLNSLKIQINPSNVIGISSTITQDLALNVSLSVPVLQFNSTINENEAFDFSVNHVKSRNDGKTIDMNIDLAVHDTDSLASSIGTAVAQSYANQPVSGSVGINGFIIGVSNTDYIDTFSTLSVNIALNTIGGVLANNILAGGLGSLSKTADALNFTVLSTNVSALPESTVGISADAQFNLVFPIEFHGVKYYSTSIGLDDTTLLNAVGNGVQLTQGLNQLNGLYVSAAFPDNDDIQKKTAKLVDTVCANGTAGISTNITMSQFYFGNSADTAFKFLSQSMSYISIPSLFLPGKSIDLGSSSISNFVINSADASFATGKRLNIASNFGVKIPNVVLNIPFTASTIGFGAGNPLVDAQISAKNPYATSKNIGVNLALGIHDTNSAANSISALFKSYQNSAALPGEISLGSVLFGVSPDDAVTILAQSNIRFLASNLYNGKQAKAEINYTSILSNLNLNLEGVSLATAPSDVINTGIQVGFQNNYGISVSNFGYTNMGIGLDSVPVASIKTSGIPIAIGANHLQLSMVTTIQDTTELKQKISAFSSDISTLGFGNTVQKFNITGVTFGLSSAEAIGILSQVVLLIPSSDLNQNTYNSLISNIKGLPSSSINLNSVMSSASLSNIVLDASVAGQVNIGGSVTLTNPLDMSLSVNIGYANFMPSLNNQNVGSTSVSILTSTKGNQLTLSLNGSAQLSNSQPLQTNIASLVNSIVSGSKNAKVVVGLSSLLFGYSANIFISAFSTIQPINVDISSAVNNVSLSSLSNATSSMGATILNTTTFDVSGPSTAVISAGVSLSGLPPQTYINIPFGQAAIQYNGNSILNGQINNLILKNNVLNTVIATTFTVNDTVAQQLFTLGGDFFTANIQNLVCTLGVNSIAFGQSKTNAFATLSKIAVQTSVNQNLKTLQSSTSTTASNLFSSIQLPTKLCEAGLVTSLTMGNSPFPLTLKLQGTKLAVTYQLDGSGPFYSIATLSATNLVVTPNTPISLYSVLLPDVSMDTGLVYPVDNLLTTYTPNNGDIAKNARLGYAQLIGSNGASFNVFANSYYQSPPLHVHLYDMAFKLVSEPSYVEGELTLLNLGADVNFRWSLPIHVDAGFPRVNMRTSSGGIFDLISTKQLIINSYYEDLTNTNFAITMGARTQLIRDGLSLLVDLGTYNIDLETRIKQDGNYVTWVDTLANNLIRSGALHDICKVVMKYLGF